MKFSELFILAFALALDVLIVSFSYGLIFNKKRFYNACRLAFTFCFFQFLMPISGWYFTEFIYIFIKNYSKWIVFIIFMLLGIKFFKEAFANKKETNICNISFICLMCLGIATSIDAFGAGISIKCLDTQILFPAVIIGIITFILSFAGFYLPCFFKKFPSEYFEISGALLLIYLAVKNLI